MKKEKRKRGKGNGTTALLILFFLAGLALLLYPTVSDYWNSLHQSRAIARYAEQVAKLDKNTYDQVWKDAQEYNKTLPGDGPRELTAAQREEYEAQLNIAGDGTIGYIEIPKIACSLPIYHGTDEAVLQIAVGHIEGSSLPVGGKSTHCVLSGHRGLPSAKLFSDLDQMEQGDTFMIRVLDEILTYEVDQILIVDPYDTKALGIEEGEDYCTLITCTPYGVNSHRMLVRGRRTENAREAKNIRVTADAIQIEPKIVAPFVAAPMLLGLFVFLLIGDRKKRGSK